ncbi:MAG TPA: protease pro-enzyme activation domain-containing protein, partial [Polyangiaceae bacterium]
MRIPRAVLAILALCAGCDSGDGGAPAATGLTVLRGTLPPPIRAATDLGRMDPGTRLEAMSLTFAPSGTRAERDALLVALQSAGSPVYHRWLTPEQYADRFGATSAEVARVSEWLGEQGFDVIGPTRGRTSLLFSGTVERLERAFLTEMHHYDVAGERHF